MGTIRAGLTALGVATFGVFIAATAAQAAGIERGAPSTRVLFEDGRYLEFSSRGVFPNLEGTSGPGANTGNLFEEFYTFGVAYKADLTDTISYAVIFDQPWGVDTAYPRSAPYTGTIAVLDSYELSGILAYDATQNIKLYAGLRFQSMTAEAAIPFVGGYTADTRTEYDMGYMAGIAYSRRDIALRVALTYYSEISHDLGITEFGVIDSTVNLTTPQSVNLEFQTGIMADTLLFGSVRWVDWSEFSLAPEQYVLATGRPLVDYEEDWITYSLGLGRRFNDKLSGFVQGSWEPATDTVLTTLGPVDGRTTLGVGLTYDTGRMKITGGLSYVFLGETSNILGTEFTDGSAIAAGIRLGIPL